MRVRATRAALGIATLGLCMAACNRRDHAVDKQSPSPAPPPTTAPSASSRRITLPRGVNVTDAADIQRRVMAHEGAAMLVNVWATWCGSCKAELPMLLKLQREYAAQGIGLLLASVDGPAEAQKAVEMLQEYGATGPTLLVGGSLETFKAQMNPRWKGSLPATFLFDRAGKLRYFWGAQAFEEEVRPILDGFLRGEQIDGAANFSVRRSPG